VSERPRRRRQGGRREERAGGRVGEEEKTETVTSPLAFSGSLCGEVLVGFGREGLKEKWWTRLGLLASDPGERHEVGRVPERKQEEAARWLRGVCACAFTRNVDITSSRLHESPRRVKTREY
jgi:hypothetical protein